MERVPLNMTTLGGDPRFLSVTLNALVISPGWETSTFTGNALPSVTSPPERDPTATLKPFCTSFKATAYECLAWSVSCFEESCDRKSNSQTFPTRPPAPRMRATDIIAEYWPGNVTRFSH